jgi:AraC-like DNA-binding protein
MPTTMLSDPRRQFPPPSRHDQPKTYCRLLRFGRVLDRLTVEPGIGWADLAAAEGYADQPHLNREFLEFAGLSPGCYRQRAPIFPRHVPV